MPHNKTTMTVSDSDTRIVNPVVFNCFLTLNLLICANLIGCFGLVGNVISILNFAKQGLNDSVNVTLTTLAVSDMGSLLCQFLVNIVVSPFWTNYNWPLSSSAVLLFFFPHDYFIRVSGFVTAFAAFERCLCVVLPLKVKTIITRKFSAIVNCSIFIALLVYLVPVYYATYLDLKYIPEKNTSVLSIFYKNNAEFVLNVTYFINDLVIPYISILILIVCTVFIITRLQSKAKWRHSVTEAKVSQSNSKATSSKENKISIMLTIVSVIYVACMTPGCVLYTTTGFILELRAVGAYFDLTVLVCSFTLLLETINCSVSIIVYYKMSSKYREIIHAWCPYLNKHS